MSKPRSTCVNFGKCREAGKSAPAGGTAACPECGQPMIPLATKGLSRPVVIAATLLAGALTIFVTVKLRADRGKAVTSSTSAASIRGGTPSFESSRYFSNDRVGTLLTTASRGDDAGVRKMLSEHPELSRAKGKGDIGLLHAALFSQDVTAFETLLKAGLDRNLAAQNGISPLMASAMHTNPRFLAVALGKTGAIPRQADSKGRDALFLAVTNRRTENVRLLLARGAEPNCKDSRGNTALMAAFQGRRPEPGMIRLLLASGANPLLADKSGLSARDFAVTFNDPEVLALLP